MRERTRQSGALGKRWWLVVGTIVVLAAAGCGDSSGDDDQSSGGGEYSPIIRPRDFSTTIDNRYFPLVPGTRWVYEDSTEEGLERIVVEVTRDTKKVQGVETVVVRDTVTLDGEVIEDTYDWFAQRRDGSVWYFGEDTKAFERGKVDRAGSWQAGVDGAQAGIVMHAKPRPGKPYRQEYYPGEAEDMGQVLGVAESVTGPTGTYRDVVKTKDYTPLEPGAVEHKYYAPGVGLVLELKPGNADARVELVEFSSG